MAAIGFLLAVTGGAVVWLSIRGVSIAAALGRLQQLVRGGGSGG